MDRVYARFYLERRYKGSLLMRCGLWCVALLITQACSSASTHDAGNSSPTTLAGGSAAPAAAATGAWLTTDDLSQGLASTPLTSSTSDRADATITLDTQQRYQSFIGVGGSLTDSSAYLLANKLSASQRDAAMHALFDQGDGIGIAFLRQPMGASDFSSVGDYSYDDVSDGGTDAQMQQFTIKHDTQYILPLLLQARALNPDLYIIAMPWSPPSWMKTNDSMDGDAVGQGSPTLKTDAFAPLAAYFVHFLQAYEAAGVKVNAVTPQNEPLNHGPGYPALWMQADAQTQFVGKNLGPAFAAAGLAPDLLVFDHNWSDENFPEQVVNDKVAAPFVHGAAFHCYGGDPSAMSTFHNNHPDKPVYMTECSGGDWQGDPFQATIDLVIDSANNWAQSVSLWNLALDENGGPTNNGCSNCRGIVTVQSHGGNVAFNADYYALGHVGRFVRTGAVRIGSNTDNGDLKVVAFQNPDTSRVVVAHNTGGNTLKVRVTENDKSFDVTLPSNAAVTVEIAP